MSCVPWANGGPRRSRPQGESRFSEARIRRYGLPASAARRANIAKIRTLLGEEAAAQDDAPIAEIIPLTLREPCPDCGGLMRIIEIENGGGKVVHGSGRVFLLRAAQ